MITNGIIITCDQTVVEGTTIWKVSAKEWRDGAVHSHAPFGLSPTKVVGRKQLNVLIDSWREVLAHHGTL